VASSFWAAYAAKLVVLGIAFAVLYAVARLLKKARLFGVGARYVDVIETTMLSPQTGVHLLRLGSRYLLVGGGNAGLFKLAELSRDEIEPPLTTVS
jgi:flagellar biogenesis protein FliO